MGSEMMKMRPWRRGARRVFASVVMHGTGDQRTPAPCNEPDILDSSTRQAKSGKRSPPTPSIVNLQRSTLLFSLHPEDQNIVVK
jgi:hypothetical protein